VGKLSGITEKSRTKQKRKDFFSPFGPAFDRRMYVYRNTTARSRNHCRSGKAISITYSEYMSVFLP
jgi:hypothetical protein